jgi:hypothetical protein
MLLNIYRLVPIQCAPGSAPSGSGKHFALLKKRSFISQIEKQENNLKNSRNGRSREKACVGNSAGGFDANQVNPECA